MKRQPGRCEPSCCSHVSQVDEYRRRKEAFLDPNLLAEYSGSERLQTSHSQGARQYQRARWQQPHLQCKEETRQEARKNASWTPEKGRATVFRPLRTISSHFLALLRPLSSHPLAPNPPYSPRPRPEGRDIAAKSRRDPHTTAGPLHPPRPRLRGDGSGERPAPAGCGPRGESPRVSALPQPSPSRLPRGGCRPPPPPSPTVSFPLHVPPRGGSPPFPAPNIYHGLSLHPSYPLALHTSSPLSPP